MLNKWFGNASRVDIPVEPVESPYLNGQYTAAGQVVDWHLESERRDKNLWRILALVLGVAIIAEVVSRPKIEAPAPRPVLVVVKKGEGIEDVSVYNNSEITVNEGMRRYFIRDFIKLARRIPLDPVLITWQRDRTESLTRGSATTFLRAEWATRRPDKQLTEQRQVVQVKIESVLAQSNDTYFVAWHEDTFTINGQPVKREQWHATLTIGDFESEEINPDNPLDISIDYLDWAMEGTR